MGLLKAVHALNYWPISPPIIFPLMYFVWYWYKYFHYILIDVNILLIFRFYFPFLDFRGLLHFWRFIFIVSYVHMHLSECRILKTVLDHLDLELKQLRIPWYGNQTNVFCQSSVSLDYSVSSPAWLPRPYCFCMLDESLLWNILSQL